MYSPIYAYPKIRDHQLTPRQILMLRVAAVFMLAFAAGYVFIWARAGWPLRHPTPLLIAAFAAVLAAALWRGWWQATMMLTFLMIVTLMIAGMAAYAAVLRGQWLVVAEAFIIAAPCAVYVHEFGYLCRKPDMDGYRFPWLR